MPWPLPSITVRIDASWEGKTGTLDEHFVWSDGGKTRRVWTLTDLGDRQYLAQMLSNLVENAIKYSSGDDRRVKVETGRRRPTGSTRYMW